MRTEKHDYFQAECKKAPCLKVNGTYGRLNNVIIRFGVELMMSTAAHPVAALTNRSDLNANLFFGMLNTKQLMSWVCFKKESECSEWRTTSARVEFNKRKAVTPMGWQYFGIIMTQLLLNVDKSVQSIVDRFDSKHNLSCGGKYAVLHLRHLEGSCISRIHTRLLTFGEPCGENGWRPDNAGTCFDAKDVCSASDRFIRFLNPSNMRLVVIHDGQQQDRLNGIVSEFGAVALPSGIDGKKAVLADCILALRATLFIGNPASTMSFNVKAARDTVRFLPGYAPRVYDSGANAL